MSASLREALVTLEAVVTLAVKLVVKLAVNTHKYRNSARRAPSSRSSFSDLYRPNVSIRQHTSAYVTERLVPCSASQTYI
jgi:hypothetical protein